MSSSIIPPRKHFSYKSTISREEVSFLHHGKSYGFNKATPIIENLSDEEEEIDQANKLQEEIFHLETTIEEKRGLVKEILTNMRDNQKELTEKQKKTCRTKIFNDYIII